MSSQGHFGYFIAVAVHTEQMPDETDTKKIITAC